MAKKLDFDKEKNNRNDNVIEEIMQADFPLPKQAEDAKNEAFSRIREMAAASGHTENTENMVQRLQEKSTEKSTGSSGKKSTGTAKSHKKFKTVYKTALGLTAATILIKMVINKTLQMILKLVFKSYHWNKLTVQCVCLPSSIQMVMIKS